MSFELFVLFAVVGGISAFLSGVIGVGGAAFLVPALLLTMPGHVPEAALMSFALGSSYTIMSLTAPVGIWMHHRWEAVDWNVVKLSMPFLIVGCALGLFAVFILHAVFQKIFFGGFLILLGIHMLLSGTHERFMTDELVPIRVRLMGGFVGLISTMVGISGLNVTFPLLRFFNMPLKAAIATATAITTPVAFIGMGGYIVAGLLSHQDIHVAGTLGYVYLPAVLGATIPGLIMSPWGAHVGHRLPRVVQHYAVSIVLIAIGGWVVYPIIMRTI